MENLKSLADAIPDAARDVRINVQNVLSEGSLSENQRLSVALACAFVARHPRLTEALLLDAAALPEEWLDDARAAAALMAMNNVYYRFRHMVGKPEYTALPARLRMQRLAQPRTGKLDFELMCLAVSAIHGCETCVQAHESSLRGLGATVAQVQDAVRIAACVQAAAVALELDQPTSAAESP